MQAQLERLTAALIPRIVDGLTKALATALEEAGLTSRVLALADRLEAHQRAFEKEPKQSEQAGQAAKQAKDPKARTCSEANCTLPARARGLCSKHYQRLRYAEKRAQEAGEPLPGSLSEARAQRGRKPARRTAKRGGTICSRDDCQRPTYAKGLCGKHFMEWVRSQKDLKTQQERGIRPEPD